MRRVVAGINMTLDGFCDHTAVEPDEEVHLHYGALMENAGVILFGRITFQLMQFWQTVLKNPSGVKAMDDFAIAIDKIPKIVFSHTLKDTGWESAQLSKTSPEEMVLALKHQPGRDVFIGSRSLIIQLMKLNLIDELQLCVHPVLAGSGIPLFENINDRTVLKLKNTKTFRSGAIVLYYEQAP